MVRDHEAVGSNPATRTMQSVLIGSEYPVMDTLLFYFLKSSYCNLFRGVAECYAFSRFHDNVGLRDLPAIRHIISTDAVIVNDNTLIGNAVLLFGVVHLDVVDQFCDHALCNGGRIRVPPLEGVGKTQTPLQWAVMASAVRWYPSAFAISWTC